MTTKSFLATANLGIYFARRIARRLLFIRSAGLNRFLDFYRDDRIAPLSGEEKNLLNAAGRCTTCGLCDSVCPGIDPEHPTFSALLTPSMLPHFSRSIPSFAGLVPIDLERCKGCNHCEAICPEQIPLMKIISFMKEKTEAVCKGRN